MRGKKTVERINSMLIVVGIIPVTMSKKTNDIMIIPMAVIIPIKIINPSL